MSDNGLIEEVKFPCMQCIMYVTNYVHEGKNAAHLTNTTSPMLFDVMYCETIFGHLDSKK